MAMPVLADVWSPDQRGYSFAIANFLPLLGPAIGPIIGGVMSGSVGWRWIFWVLSMFDALLLISTLFISPETSATQLLHKKAQRIRKETGRDVHTEESLQAEPISRRLTASLTRPYRLLATQPIIQLMSVYTAYNFGVLYIVLSTFATLWTEHSEESVSRSGLHYVALAIGYTIATQVGGPLMDHIWKSLKARADGTVQPEYRIPLMVPGNILIPIGLFWYGWAAEAHVLWIVPDIAIAVFGCGIILSLQSSQAYVVDSFGKYVASASAASQLLRSVAGFAFPLFAPKLYQSLGYGWGNSLLGFLFIAIGIPAPLMLWRYGAKLRGMGKPQW